MGRPQRVGLILGYLHQASMKQKTLLRREYNTMAKQRGVNTPVFVLQ